MSSRLQCAKLCRFLMYYLVFPCCLSKMSLLIAQSSYRGGKKNSELIASRIVKNCGAVVQAKPLSGGEWETEGFPNSKFPSRGHKCPGPVVTEYRAPPTSHVASCPQRSFHKLQVTRRGLLVERLFSGMCTELRVSGLH